MFEATDTGRSTYHYKLTSTVILQLGSASEALGKMNLAGNLTRQAQTDMQVKDDTSQVVNIGKVGLAELVLTNSHNANQVVAGRRHGTEDA